MHLETNHGSQERGGADHYELGRGVLTAIWGALT